MNTISGARELLLIRAAGLTGRFAAGFAGILPVFGTGFKENGLNCCIIRQKFI
jgi:hypothetical protein